MLHLRLLIARWSRGPELADASAQSTSSFECDGCAHHASFHSMENKEEDEIRKRWEQEAREKTRSESQDAERPRKRAREIEYAREDASSQARLLEGGLITLEEEEGASEAGRRAVKAKPKAKAKPRRKAAGPLLLGTRTKGRITEIEEDDEDYVELD